MVTHSMRPKYKEDVICIPTSDGVYLRSGTGRLRLKGKSLYPLLEKLIPLLNGSLTLEELTAGLVPARQQMLTHLLEKLLAHAFVKDASQERRDLLCLEEIATYTANITYLETSQPAAPGLFATFRRQRLLLTGCREGIIALVQAGLQAGVRQLTVLVDPQERVQSAPDEGVANWLAPCDKEQVVAWIPAPCWEQDHEVRAVVQKCDAVVQICGATALPRARLLNRLCLAEGKVLLQAMVQGDQAWIGPVVSAETGNCWECAWRRWQTNREALCVGPWPEEPLGRVDAAVIAQRLLFALFQSVICSSDQLAGRVSVLDLPDWHAESYRFFPHPGCTACQQPEPPSAAQFLGQVQQMQRRAPLQREEMVRALAGCVDARCGMFTGPDVQTFFQVPLAVSAVSVACPGRPLEGIATGRDPQQASERALCKACELYAAHCVAVESLYSTRDVLQYAAAFCVPEQVPGADLTLPACPGWAWALDLQTEQAVLLALAHLPVERGVALGGSWDEAVCQALLEWCTVLTLAEIGAAQRPYPRVDLARVPFTPTGAYLSGLLKTVAAGVVIYDVTGSLGLPTFAICLGERVVAYTAHFDVGQALDMGLERALQQYQSEHFQQAAYALAPVPDCPQQLRSAQYSLPTSALPEHWSDRRIWLLERLQQRGWRCLVRPLTADSSLAAACPWVVHVLVCRGREQQRGEIQ